MAIWSMYVQTLFRLLCLGSLLYGILLFFLHVCHDALRYLCLRLRLLDDFWGGIHGSCM